jgi:hypothetical protein
MQENSCYLSDDRNRTNKVSNISTQRINTMNSWMKALCAILSLLQVWLFTGWFKRSLPNYVGSLIKWFWIKEVPLIWVLFHGSLTVGQRHTGSKPPFLTLAVDGGKWSASHTSHFNPGEITPSAQWIRGWVGLRFGLDTVDKRKILPCWESNLSLPACSLLLYWLS